MDKPLKLHGVIPAIVTPFTADLALDEQGLRRYVRHMLGIPGVSGILCNGYTGELSSLGRRERARVVEICAEEIGGRVPLIAGTDGRSTSEAIALAREAKAAGADGIQVNSPFEHLLKRGMLLTPDVPVAFFRALSDEAAVPMLVFQYPAWSGIAYPTGVTRALADIEYVAAVKEAVDIDKYVEEHQALNGRIPLFADNNGYTLLAMLLLGADGTMVGISNVGTELWAELFAAVQQGEVSRAVELTNRRLLPLMDVFSRDLGRTPASFVGRVKEALVMQGLLETAAVRAPEAAVSDAERATIKAALAAVGILPR